MTPGKQSKTVSLAGGSKTKPVGKPTTPTPSKQSSQSAGMQAGDAMKLFNSALQKNGQLKSQQVSIKTTVTSGDDGSVLSTDTEDLKIQDQNGTYIMLIQLSYAGDGETQDISIYYDGATLYCKGADGSVQSQKAQLNAGFSDDPLALTGSVSSTESWKYYSCAENATSYVLDFSLPNEDLSPIFSDDTGLDSSELTCSSPEYIVTISKLTGYITSMTIKANLSVQYEGEYYSLAIKTDVNYSDPTQTVSIPVPDYVSSAPTSIQ